MRHRNVTMCKTCVMGNQKMFDDFDRIDSSVDDGSLGRLVNDEHRKPNCVMKLVEIDGFPHLRLFTLRMIKCGEEIRYSYGKGTFPWRMKVRGSLCLYL